MFKNILLILQIMVPVLLIALILLQQRGTAMGSAFGGAGASYSNRRGIEKKMFTATIVLACVFLVISLLNLIIR